MAGINISFASDVRPFLKGTGDAERGLDDVADALDDLTRDASRKGKAIGDDLEKVGDEGTDAAKVLERKFRDAFDDVKKEAKTAGDAVGDHVKRGTDKAGDGTKALSENADANAKEVAASFDGSAESIADGFQGLAAEAFEGFGPAGVAAGVIAAAGIGLVTAEMTKTKEEAEALEQKINDLAAAIVESADPAEAMGEAFTKTMEEWVYGGELFGRTYAKAREELESMGVTGEDADAVLRALAGRPEDQARATDILTAAQDRYKQAFADGADLTAIGYHENLRNAMKYGDQVATSAEQIAESERRAREAARLTGQQWVTNEAEARDAYTGLGTIISNLPTSIPVTVDTGAAERALEDFVRRTRKVEIGVSYRGGQAVV